MKRFLAVFLVMFACLFVFASCGEDKNTDTSTDTGENIACEHVEEVIPAVSPTCTENGLTEGKKCSLCGQILVEQAVIVATGHSHEAVLVVEPTCTQDGFTTYLCECGDNYKGDYVDMIPHAFGEWEVELYPSCLTDGLNVRTCTYGCGEFETEAVPSDGHVGTSVTKPATCTEDGYTTHSCETCGNVYISDHKPATGHIYGEWQTGVVATCLEDGENYRTCTADGCEEVQIQTVYAIGHHYENAGVQAIGSYEYNIYECSRCADTYQVQGDEIPVPVTDIEKVDCPIDFTFNVLSDGTKEFVEKNIDLYYSSFEGSEYFDDERVHFAVTATDLGNGVWEISTDNCFDYAQNYTVVLGEGIVFEEAKTQKMNFSTEKDPNHIDQVEYSDEVLFLKKLEIESSGYYPYYTQEVEGSDSLYLILSKIGDLKVGDVLCVGDITSFEEAAATGAEDCYIGKIGEISKNDGKRTYILRLDPPELTDVFDNLDVTYDDFVNLEDAEAITENLSDEVRDALYADEDFLCFVNSVNLAAREYLAENDCDTSVVSTASFLDKIKITPKVAFQGTTLILEIDGSINIPMKTNSGKELGSIDVSFHLGATAGFKMGLTYRLKWFIIPVGLKEFDLYLTQTTTIDFNFDVKIKMEYQANGDFIINDESGKIHCTNCVYVERIKDKSKIRYITAESAHYLIEKNPKDACMLCKPVEGLNRDAFVLNTYRNTIHAYNCFHVGQMDEANKKITTETVKYWTDRGYNACDYCQPQRKEQLEFVEKMEQSTSFSDWSKNLKEIASTAKHAGTEGSNRKAIPIAKLNFPICYVLNAGIQFNFVLDFKLEASLSYKFSYEQVNTYGIRLQNGSMKPYEQKHQEIKEHSIKLMGEAELRVGFEVDATIEIAVIGKWANAGVRAGVGVYARIAGIYLDSNLNEPGIDYAAAYFEMGVYVNVTAHYTLLWFNGELTILDYEFPFFVMGYDAAYFAYKEYVDTLVIDGSYDIEKEDLLVASYYNLQKMEEAEKELDVNGTDKYKVIISFEDGRYCRVENGVIVPTDDAPCYFEDKITIKVEGTADWIAYKKHNPIFYLADYTIDLKFYSGNPHDHELLESKEPTCTEKGYEKYACVCGDSYVNELREIPHDYTATVTKEATCVLAGYTTYTCVVCQDSYGRDVPDAIGHDFYDDKCRNCGEIESGLVYTFNEETQSFAVTGIGSCTASELVIPSKYNGYPVTAIGDSVFEGDLNLTKITIPSGITSIGEYAFSECEYLKTVAVPDTITEIGVGAFQLCSNLKSIDIPDGVTVIPNEVFAECMSLESVKISMNIESIGDKAFAGCMFLESIELPYTLKSIGYLAFYDCVSLKTVKYQGNVKEWCALSFGNLTANPLNNGSSLYCEEELVETLVIPKIITEINPYAFAGCTSIKTVVIHVNVEKIGSYAFDGCKNLTIKCEAKEQPSAWDVNWNPSNRPVEWDYDE